jgi:hypothetical protein
MDPGAAQAEGHHGLCNGFQLADPTNRVCMGAMVANLEWPKLVLPAHDMQHGVLILGDEYYSVQCGWAERTSVDHE